MSAPIGVAVIGKLVAEDLFLGVGEVVVDSPAGGPQEGTLINIDTLGYVVYSSWAPAAVAAGSYQTTTVNVPGAEVHHKVIASFDGAGFVAQPRLLLDAKVSSAGVVTVTIHNLDTGAGYTPGSGTIRVCVLPVPSAL